MSANLKALKEGAGGLALLLFFLAIAFIVEAR